MRNRDELAEAAFLKMMDSHQGSSFVYIATLAYSVADALIGVAFGYAIGYCHRAAQEKSR